MVAMAVLAEVPSVDIQSNYKIIKQRNIKLPNPLSSQFVIPLSSYTGYVWGDAQLCNVAAFRSRPMKQSALLKFSTLDLALLGHSEPIKVNIHLSRGVLDQQIFLSVPF